MKYKALVIALTMLAASQAQASVTVTYQPVVPILPPIVEGGLEIIAVQPSTPISPENSLGQVALSASVGGSFSYTVNNGTKSGFFSENETSADGALLSLALDRYGYGYNARAYTENGGTHAYASTEYTNNASGYGSSSANATSTYSDWFVISGGTGMAYASLDAFLDGTLNGGTTGTANVMFSVNYTPQSSCYYWWSCDASQTSQVVISESKSINGRSSRTSFDAFTSEFAFTYDTPFQLTTTLTVSASNGGSADFFDTGLIGGIDLPVGAQLTSASGLFVATNVPEPETYALMLAGLGLVGFMAGKSKIRR